MVEKKEKNLPKLKEEYELLKKKYKLPDFTYLNENFEIENILVDDTQLLLKSIRKHITEKLFFTLRTLEMFANPQNAPMFMIKIIKHLSENEKDLTKQLYRKMSYYEIDAFGLESIYDEKKEADFIIKVSDDWKIFSQDLNKIYLAMKASYGREAKKSDGSYFG
jgi:hypothetical protein